jgi:hypothetical protein
MKLAAIVSLATLASGALWMQDGKPERFTHPMPKNPEEGMARWMQTCKPGPAHERLKELLGTYDITMRMWMDQSKPPMESKGTTETSWLVEGKWLISKINCDMMGQKVAMTSILGYDNFKERYVCVWVDSLQTCMATAFGHFDQSGDNLILWGTIDEPMTPEQDKQCKYVWRGFGKDKFVFEVHDMMIGETNTKVVEFEYVRKKK